MTCVPGPQGVRLEKHVLRAEETAKDNELGPSWWMTEKFRGKGNPIFWSMIGPLLISANWTFSWWKVLNHFYLKNWLSAPSHDSCVGDDEWLPELLVAAWKIGAPEIVEMQRCTSQAEIRLKTCFSTWWKYYFMSKKAKCTSISTSWVFRNAVNMKTKKLYEVARQLTRKQLIQQLTLPGTWCWSLTSAIL